MEVGKADGETLHIVLERSVDTDCIGGTAAHKAAEDVRQTTKDASAWWCKGRSRATHSAPCGVPR